MALSHYYGFITLVLALLVLRHSFRWNWEVAIQSLDRLISRLIVLLTILC